MFSCAQHTLKGNMSVRIYFVDKFNSYIEKYTSFMFNKGC